MKLHIVGGFLGSGKTTAIINAAKVWSTEGKKVGVITNDPDKYHEDTGLANANYSPSEEVINGCFSSDFDSLNDKIVRLNQDVNPDHIFAESVGSCTDLVSTVVKPLMIFNKNIFESLTFSTFVDARLLLSYLRGDKLVFSDDVIYIFSKQIEEADLLIVNMIDQIPSANLLELKRLVDRKLRDKNIICQNSRDPENLSYWLDTIDSLPKQKRKSLNIDYQLYGKGETDLIWLDEEIHFNTTKSEAYEFAIRFIEDVVFTIRQKQIPVGHIKFLLVSGEQMQKVSFTAIPDEDWQQNISPVPSNLVKLIMYARIETTQMIALTIIREAMEALSSGEVKVSKNNAIASPSGFSIPAHPIRKGKHCCEECICLKNILARNAIRLEDGSAAALAELEDEQFDCLCDCDNGDGCCC